MTRGLRDALLLAVLLGLSAAFGAMVLRTASAPPRPELPETPAEASSAGTVSFALPEVRPTPIGRLAAALERPLFAQSRRPPAAPAPAPTELDATLAGVLSAGAERVAIVLAPGAQRGLRLREGDEFRGWRVSEIDDRSVLLERDGRTERLELTYRRTGPPPEPPE